MYDHHISASLESVSLSIVLKFGLNVPIPINVSNVNLRIPENEVKLQYLALQKLAGADNENRKVVP